MTDRNATMRETDRWLRRAAVYIPVIAFMVGWGSGVVTTFLVFKDHERRISILETTQKERETLDRVVDSRLEHLATIIEERFKIK